MISEHTNLLKSMAIFFVYHINTRKTVFSIISGTKLYWNQSS